MWVSHDDARHDPGRGGPYPRGQLRDLHRRVNNALAAAGTGPKNDDMRDALDDYIRRPDPAGAVILLHFLTQAIGEDRAYVALDFLPPAPGLVWCCGSMGWVTPAERAEHQYDSSFGWD
jgi:hypothetical protein